MPRSSHENLEKQPASQEELSILIEKELIEDSELEPEEWTKKYGKRYRGIITKNPELLNDKEKIKKAL